MSRSSFLVVASPVLAAAMLAVACGDDDAGNATSADGGGDGATGQDTSTSPDTGTTGTPDGSAAETLTFTTYASFNAAIGELPEGVVVKDGTPIVTFAPNGQLMNVLSDGGTTVFGSFASVSNAFTLGLAITAQKDIFVAVAENGTSPSPSPGVYKFISAGGAPGAYMTSGPQLGFTNALDFIGTDLFVSDSKGTIFKVAETGVGSAWKSDLELEGDVTACNSQNGFPIGVNGISHDDTYVYGVNLDKGSFFRIQRNPNGTAGAVEILFKDCAFFGADGVARDSDGTFIIANTVKNRIDRVTLGKNNASYTTIASGAPLDGPASVFIDGTAANKKLWVTNSAFGSAAADGGTPKPSLVFAQLK